MKITVNLVDDHRIVTDGLTMIIDGDEEIEIMDVAQSGSMALAQLESRTPDVILLDYSLGDKGEEENLNGLKVAEEILAKHPDVKILMLTMHNNHEVIVPCIMAGVHGYMLKSEKNADISTSIKHLYQHGHYFSPEVAKDLAVSIRKHNLENVSLSEREQEVLDHLYRGSSTKEIAEELFISHHTVESHRKSLIQKFEAKNSVHLIYLALQKGHLTV
ncbi:MAG TPA: response regulator transcription factor [Cryomorphaceae bacterium]|nr:response regulator transcription factor [Cryomorphaceae bacterium]